MTALAVSADQLGPAIRLAALSVYADELQAAMPTFTGDERDEAAAELLAVRRAARQIQEAH